jgi:nitric oxide reductase subunit C
LGKHVWNDTVASIAEIHGEGAYFAPELGNVTTRWGVQDDPENNPQGWMDAQPKVESRASPDLFEITDEEMRLAEFLRWADQTDTWDWPPTDAG